MSFPRIAGWSGIAFLVLLALNLVFLGNTPFPDDSATEVRDYIAKDEGLHKTGLFLGVVLLPFAVFFFAGVVNSLRASDREHNEAWAIAALAGAILVGAAAGTGDVMTGIVLYRGGEGLDDATVRALWDGQGIAYSTTGIAFATLTLSVAIPTLQRRASWPAWHGWLGLLVAVLGVLGTIGVVADSNTGGMFGFVALGSFAVWALVTSILLIRGREA